VKRVVLTAAVAVLAGGVAMAVPVASDRGFGGTNEWEATSLIGGAPYLSGHDGAPAPYYIPYGGYGITFSNAPAAAEEDLVFIYTTNSLDPDGAGPLLPVAGQNWGILGVQSITGSYSNQYAGSVEFFSVYFLGNSGALWMLDLPTTEGLHDFEANLLWGNWYDRSGTYGQTEFLADILTTVTDVGYRLAYDATYSGWATFGITDITLNDEILGYIPEPRTYAMLGMALVSLGVTFRRRLSSAVDSVKSRIVG
jgi:hypothetical protein